MNEAAGRQCERFAAAAAAASQPTLPLNRACCLRPDPLQSAALCWGQSSSALPFGWCGSVWIATPGGGTPFSSQSPAKQARGRTECGQRPGQLLLLLLQKRCCSYAGKGIVVSLALCTSAPCTWQPAGIDQAAFFAARFSRCSGADRGAKVRQDSGGHCAARQSAGCGIPLCAAARALCQHGQPRQRRQPGLSVSTRLPACSLLFYWAAL